MGFASFKPSNQVTGNFDTEDAYVLLRAYIKIFIIQKMLVKSRTPLKPDTDSYLGY